VGRGRKGKKWLKTLQRSKENEWVSEKKEEMTKEKDKRGDLREGLTRGGKRAKNGRRGEMKEGRNIG